MVVSSRNDDSGAEEVLAILQNGDYFGEIALPEDTPRTATVRTRTDCVFLTLPCDAFLKLLEDSPELSGKFARVSHPSGSDVASVRATQPSPGRRFNYRYLFFTARSGLLSTSMKRDLCCRAGGESRLPHSGSRTSWER